MFRRISHLKKATLGLAIAFVAVTAIPTIAKADRFHDHGRVGIDIDLHTAPAPVIVDRPQQVWVEPIYQTVVDRVWVPETRELRDINHGRYITRETVIIPGHYQDIPRQVCVAEGHYETRVDRVAIEPPHHDGARFDFHFPFHF